MTTQLEAACCGEITAPMQAVAADERVSPETIREDIACGHAVLPLNPAHAGCLPSLVGSRYRTKINANLGCSVESASLPLEKQKLTVAVDAGADFVMDLSVGPDVGTYRKTLLADCSVPLGTVPVYEALSRVDGETKRLSAELLLRVVRDHAEAGVDFMTLHAGLLHAHVEMALERKMGIVSRGGAVLAEWMRLHESENPLYESWDEVLDVCRAHDVTVSLGDGLRPGCLADASDAAQFAELDALGGLVRRCRDAGVQVMVEGPGHVPFDQIQMNVERQQEVCDGAPFYVLGPVVTDIAPGYDHITSCIGATAAAFHGASLLCYVTPAEHLGLPTEQDVHEGVMAYRIAAHAADIAKGVPGAREKDDAMADARMAFDWDRQFSLAMDGARARSVYEKARVETADTDHCSMCGKDFCSVRATRRMSGCD